MTKKKKGDGLLHLGAGIDSKRSICGIKVNVKRKPTPHEMGTLPTCTPCALALVDMKHEIGEALCDVANAYAEFLNVQRERIVAERDNLNDDVTSVIDAIDALDSMRNIATEKGLITPV